MFRDGSRRGTRQLRVQRRSTRQRDDRRERAAERRREPCLAPSNVNMPSRIRGDRTRRWVVAESALGRISARLGGVGESRTRNAGAPRERSRGRWCSALLERRRPPAVGSVDSSHGLARSRSSISSTDRRSRLGGSRSERAADQTSATPGAGAFAKRPGRQAERTSASFGITDASRDSGIWARTRWERIVISPGSASSTAMGRSESQSWTMVDSIRG